MSQQRTLSFPGVLSLDSSAPQRADCGILRFSAGKLKVEESDYSESDVIGLEIEKELVREIEMFSYILRGSYVQDVLSIVSSEEGNKVVLLKSIGCSLSSYIDNNIDKLFVRESRYAYWDMSSLFIHIVRSVVNALASFHDRGFCFGRHLTCHEVRVVEKENQHPDIKFYPVGRVATADRIKQDYDNIGNLIIEVQMRSGILVSHEIEDLVAILQAGPNQGQLNRRDAIQEHPALWYPLQRVRFITKLYSNAYFQNLDPGSLHVRVQTVLNNKVLGWGKKNSILALRQRIHTRRGEDQGAPINFLKFACHVLGHTLDTDPQYQHNSVNRFNHKSDIGLEQFIRKTFYPAMFIELKDVVGDAYKSWISLQG